VDGSVRRPRRRSDNGCATSRIEHLAHRYRREAAGEALMRGDAAIEKGADKLETLAGRAAAKGGLAGKLADSLGDDATFVRQLKPSLIVARARGEAPKDREPGSAQRAPRRPQHGPRKPSYGQDQNPFVIAGAAFGLGALVARLIDWRSHAHPRR